MQSTDNYASSTYRYCVPGTILDPSSEQNRQNPVLVKLTFWWLFLLPSGLMKCTCTSFQSTRLRGWELQVSFAQIPQRSMKALGKWREKKKEPALREYPEVTTQWESCQPRHSTRTTPQQMGQLGKGIHYSPDHLGSWKTLGGGLIPGKSHL